MSSSLDVLNLVPVGQPGTVTYRAGNRGSKILTTGMWAENKDQMLRGKGAQ